MTLALSPAGILDRVVLRGALAVQLGDGLLAQPADFARRVTALRASDRRALSTAVSHPSGVSGFLTLRAGDYLVLVEPGVRQYLPSLRPVTIAAPPTAPKFIGAYLRPSPSYPPPPNAVVLRGTLQWGPAPPPTASAPQPPARWMVVVATLFLSGTTTQVSTTWTRSDGNGEFALILPAAPPTSDGVVQLVSAKVEIHAPAAPPPPPPDPTALDDLPPDADDDAITIGAQPVRKTLLEPGLSPGAEISLNQDSYSFLPPGAAQPVDNHVVLL